YKNRAKPVTWTIKVQPPTGPAPLPDGLLVSVSIATDVTQPRKFDATSIGNGAYRVTLTPVPPETDRPVEVRVFINGTWIETSVPDRAIRVGRASLLLSDLTRLMENPPRVITRKGEMAVGPISNLPKAKARVGPRAKQVVVDLSRASVIQV